MNVRLLFRTLPVLLLFALLIAGKSSAQGLVLYHDTVHHFKILVRRWRGLDFHDGNVYFFAGTGENTSSISFTKNKRIHNLQEAATDFLKEVKLSISSWNKCVLIDKGALENDRGYWFLTLDSVDGPHSMRYQSHFLNAVLYQKPNVVTLRFELFRRNLNIKEQEIWPVYMKMAESFKFD